MKERRSYQTALRILAKKKGYGSSITKAVEVALKEEMPFARNRPLLAYIVYSLCKAYFRNYKAFVKNIYFKKGVIKFVIYSLDIYQTGEGKQAYSEIKETWLNELGKRD